MRILPLWLFLFWGIGVLHAQVDVELILEQDQFLRDEPLPIKVRVTNRSGQTLHLGESNDWLTFNLENPGRTPVECSGPVPVTSPFELESAHMATREVNLQPYFELSQPGRYSVSAVVRIKQWDRELPARPKVFEIMRGAKLWEQEVGVPGAPGAPESRRFILQQANYRKQLKLYLRVSNSADTYAFKVLPLGPLVSFGRPEAQIDEQSNLHILFQTGARTFQYSHVTPDGILTARHSYDYGARRPTLRLNETGKIVVNGGIRRFATDDLPAIVAATPTLPPSETSAPPATSAPPPTTVPAPDKDVAPPRK